MSQEPKEVTDVLNYNVDMSHLVVRQDGMVSLNRDANFPWVISNHDGGLNNYSVGRSTGNLPFGSHIAVAKSDELLYSRKIIVVNADENLGTRVMLSKGSKNKVDMNHIDGAKKELGEDIIEIKPMQPVIFEVKPLQAQEGQKPARPLTLMLIDFGDVVHIYDTNGQTNIRDAMTELIKDRIVYEERKRILGTNMVQTVTLVKLMGLGDLSGVRYKFSPKGFGYNELVCILKTLEQIDLTDTEKRGLKDSRLLPEG